VSAVTPGFVFRGHNRRAVSVLLALTLLTAPPPVSAQETGPTKIILDASPRAIEYQLGRLTVAELTRVERKADDPRYRPIYLALLTRKGIGREYFDEALEVLTKTGKTSRGAVLMEGLARLPADDDETAAKLVRALLGQPVAALRADAERFTEAIASQAPPPALRGAYGGMLLIAPDPQAVFQNARASDAHLLEFLKVVPLVPAAAGVGKSLAGPVVSVLSVTTDPAVRAAALTALATVRPDAQTFSVLANDAVESPDSDTRLAAMRALRTLPREAWPAAEVENVARALVAALGKGTPEARVEPDGLEAIQLVEKLSGALPEEARRAVRRDLRALGVRVIRIETVPEQMMFDLRWFVVEAGKPVQIVLTNPDAMSHNLLVIKPGGLKEVGTAAGSMSMPSDPAAKPYVPDTPLVLQATRLLNWAESERLNFVAPTQPGEYPFACTFPGHWVRMYGVMLVVENLDAWEAKPTAPVDPVTGRPYDAQRQ
jgi:azurin